MNIIFFGSFQHYSALILQALINTSEIYVAGIVTTPPTPVGRKQILTKTPVHVLAEAHDIPVFAPEKLDKVHDIFPNQPDFFITAGYGKILPQSWLDYPIKGCLNLHFSLLPKYRGANPAEWAIMCGETETGISLIHMSQQLDGGDVINQEIIPISPIDTRETLYQKLYNLGAKFLPLWLVDFEHFQAKPQPKNSPTPYAALLKRQDGFIPWTKLINQSLKAIEFSSVHLQTAFEFSPNQSEFLHRLPRALAGFPSLWTIVPTHKGDKRMKILSFNPYTVQIEGQQPALYNQIKNLII